MIENGAKFLAGIKRKEEHNQIKLAKKLSKTKFYTYFFVGNCFTHTKVITSIYVLHIPKHKIKLQSSRVIVFLLYLLQSSLHVIVAHARGSLDIVGITCSIYTNKTEYQQFQWSYSQP